MSPHRFAQVLAFVCVPSSIGVLTACSDPPISRDTHVGSPCGGASGRACDSRLTCLTDARLPGGYCTRECGPESCPSGSECVAIYGAQLCLGACSDDLPCRDGYQCWRGVCRGRCAGTDDCGEGTTCTGGACGGAECTSPTDCAGEGAMCVAGRCVAGPPPPDVDAGPPPIPVVDAGPPGPKENGEPCTTHGECMSLVCLPADLGGTCAPPCADRASCEAISFDLACVPIDVDSNGDGALDSTRNACAHAAPSARLPIEPCSTDADCASRFCGTNLCVDPCDSPDDCLPGTECLTTVRPSGVPWQGCTFGPSPGTVTVTDIPLGEATIAAGTTGPRLALGVPLDAVSVTLIAEPIGGDPLPLVFEAVYAPDESTIYDYARLLGSWEDTPIRWLPDASGGAISMLIPNTTPDRYAFQVGRYGWDVFGAPRSDGDTGSVDVRFTARVKRAPGGDITNGVLGVNLYLVGVGLDAASAATDSRLQAALGYVRDIFAPSGIAFEVAQYVDVDPTTASPLAVIDSSGDPGSELSRLFQLSAGQTNQAVDVFLVRGIAEGAGEGGIVLGIAGGIPGPPFIHGTGHSGVALAFDPGVVGGGDQGALIVSQIMAHELGHYLGLFHVRESADACAAGVGPTMADPCAPFGGGDVLSDTSMGRAGGSNLMWWALGGSDGRTYNVDLSSGQGFVMRRHAVVR